jgi:hypothetical protein
MQCDLIEPFGHSAPGPRQETCLDAVGGLTEPQIKACRLHLIIIERRGMGLMAPASTIARMSWSGRMPSCGPKEGSVALIVPDCFRKAARESIAHGHHTQLVYAKPVRFVR